MQAINLKAATDFAASAGTPLTAHCIIHWVGTDAGDDPTGELFAEVREQWSRWLRYRGIPFAAVWSREKRSGGQAEVEHGHLLFHLPDAWLKGAKLISVSGGLEGGVKLQDVQAALYRIVRRCAGRPEYYAVKLRSRPMAATLVHTTDAPMTAFIFSRAGANRLGNYSRVSSRNGASHKASSSANVAAALRALAPRLVAGLVTMASWTVAACAGFEAEIEVTDIFSGRG